MILTPATRLQDHPEALTLLKLLRHFGYSSAQIMQALAHLDGDRPTEKAVAQAARECIDELKQRGEMEHYRLMKYFNIPLSEIPKAMRLLQKLMDVGYSAREITQAALLEEVKRAEKKQVRVWHYEICHVSGNWHEDETPHKPDEEMFVVRNVRPIYFGEYTEPENSTAEKADDEAFFALLDSRHINYTLSENGAVMVHDDLDLRDADITTTLPDNLSVSGYLDLEGTGITTLPDNLSIGSNLYLQGTGITTLPDNLSVGGYLDLGGTSITVIPGSVHVGGNIVTGAFRAGTDGGAA